MRKSPFVIVVVLVCLLVVAAPAAGKASLEGTQHIEFNFGFMEGGACEHITWTGEVTLNGVTYDISYQPTGDRATGRAFHFDEIVRIHPHEAITVEAGVVTVCPEDSLLMLENSGVGTPNSRGLANGKVIYVNPAGPFDQGLVGSTTHWRGVVSDDQLSFSGSFRIN